MYGGWKKCRSHFFRVFCDALKESQGRCGGYKGKNVKAIIVLFLLWSEREPSEVLGLHGGRVRKPCLFMIFLWTEREPSEVWGLQGRKNATAITF